MADIGHIALFLALVASVYSAIAYIFGVRGRHPALIKSARGSLLVTCGLVSVSVTTLLIAILFHNFQIEYVNSYTSRDTSLFYLLSALWAGNAGSLLFWGWLLSIFAAIVVVQNRNNDGELITYTAAVLMITEIFFLILLLFVKNPFVKLVVVPANGMGLNPILENPGMIFHPPILLAGYAALTIPFAYGIAGLLTGKFTLAWIQSLRGWMLLAWLLLGGGNIIGAWWAYAELGWGGYWAWDPVENAGFMPWLVATAFLHSIIVQRKRGMFRVWNMVLVILAFSLSIFGTFLTRSGILSSVHSFSESAMNPFFITFIGIALFSSLSILFYRRKMLRSAEETNTLLSREGILLLSNIMFVGVTLIIFIGTVFPFISEALNGNRITLGASFFNRVTGPIFLFLVLLMGIGTLVGWRKESVRKLAGKLLYSFICAFIVCSILIFMGLREWYTLTLFPLCTFVLCTIIFNWYYEIRTRQRLIRENLARTFISLIRGNKPHYGGMFVHIGIVLITLGVIGSSFYQVEKEVVMLPDESLQIKNYTLTYTGMEQYTTSSKVVVTTLLDVYRGGKLVDQMKPEKYFHNSYQQPVTEVAIRTTLLEDLYVILGGWTEDGAVTFQVLVNPLVIWIWIGGGFLLMGGLLALWPGRMSAENSN